jgi:hypothetical protein
MMSTAFAVAVIVGAVPPGHLTPVKVAVVMLVAELVSRKTKDWPAVGEAGIVNVQGVPAVRIAVRTVPAVITNVKDAPTTPAVPQATTDSVYPEIVGVVSVGEVENTRFVLVVPVAPEAV